MRGLVTRNLSLLGCRVSGFFQSLKRCVAIVTLEAVVTSEVSTHLLTSALIGIWGLPGLPYGHTCPTHLVSSSGRFFGSFTFSDLKHRSCADGPCLFPQGRRCVFTCAPSPRPTDCQCCAHQPSARPPSPWSGVPLGQLRGPAGTAVPVACGWAF